MADWCRLLPDSGLSEIFMGRIFANENADCLWVLFLFFVAAVLVVCCCAVVFVFVRCMVPVCCRRGIMPVSSSASPVPVFYFVLADLGVLLF